MNRRFFLEGIGYTTLASLIAGCGNSSTDRFNVQILRRSLPVQLLRQVKKELDPKVGIKVGTQTSVSELFGQLQTWKQKESKSDPGPNELRLVGLGDYWLTQAISENLIRPLNIKPQLSKQLPPQVQQLMQRDEKGYPSAEGAIWGAPYRWGATVIVYRKDRLKEFDWELRDWSDFWRPELQGRVGLLNQPREVIGMTLHTLGLSYNDPNPNTHQELAPQLKALHQQTKFYGSTNYLQALMLGDTWVSMGWSSDVLPALKQDDKLGVIFPESGSSLWADMWVQSASTQEREDFPEESLLSQWVSYWWSDSTAHDISRFTNASAIIQSKESQDNPNLSQVLLSADNFKKSEFLLPLSPESNKTYKDLWLKVRES